MSATFICALKMVDFCAMSFLIDSTFGLPVPGIGRNHTDSQGNMLTF
jgi:hypothetical protein